MSSAQINLLLEGALFTIAIALGGAALGLVVGFAAGLARVSESKAIRTIGFLYVEIFRGAPVLVLAFWFIYALPALGWQLVPVWAGMLAVGLNIAAYAAEVVRGGLQAIPRGQYEAADAIGLRYWQTTRRIVLPQALRIVIPGLMNDIIRAFKNTTFVSIIGLFDVLGATKAALEDPNWIRFAPEAYLFVFALYFVFCLSMSKYSESVERDLRKGRNF